MRGIKTGVLREAQKCPVFLLHVILLSSFIHLLHRSLSLSLYTHVNKIQQHVVVKFILLQC